MPVLIKNRDLDYLVQSLSALDGRPEVIKVVGTDGSDKNMVNIIPYKLPAKIRLLAARWLTALRGQAEEVKKAQEGIFKQFQVEQTSEEGKPAKPPVIPADKVPEYMAEIEVLREATKSHDLDLLPVAMLNVEANNLPVTVLTGLSTIIDHAEPAKT